MADLFAREVGLPQPPPRDASPERLAAWAREATVAISNALVQIRNLFGGIADGEFVKRSGPRLIGGAGGSGAPTDAEYITGAAHAGLSAERVATDTSTVDVDTGTAAQAKWHAVGLRVTGPVDLVAGAVADGEFVKRVGATLVGATPPGGSPPTGTGFRHVTGGVEDAAAEKVTFSDADQVTPNQGTTTTVLHGNAAGQPAFAAVALAADVSGTLPIGNGGTGQTGATAAFDALAPTTSQGDTIYHDGSDNVRLAKGSNNTTLRMTATIPAWEAELLSKDITIEAPTAAEDITMFYTPIAITVTEVRVVQVGSASPSLTLQLKHSTDRSAAGNNLTTSGAFTNTTTGSTATLSDDTIPAASYVWIETTAQSGTIVSTAIHVRYTVD